MFKVNPKLQWGKIRLVKPPKSKQERVIQFHLEFQRWLVISPAWMRSIRRKKMTYVERLEMFFVVNNVPEEKKAAILLTLMGGRCMIC